MSRQTCARRSCCGPRSCPARHSSCVATLHRAWRSCPCVPWRCATSCCSCGQTFSHVQPSCCVCRSLTWTRTRAGCRLRGLALRARLPRIAGRFAVRFHAAALIVTGIAVAVPACETAAFAATAVLLVDGCPRAPLGLVAAYAALLVPFLDVFGLAFLLVRVFVLAASVAWRSTPSVVERLQSGQVLMISPPFGCRTCPTKKAESSVARKTKQGAISSGSAGRPSGTSPPK